MPLMTPAINSRERPSSCLSQLHSALVQFDAETWPLKHGFFETRVAAHFTESRLVVRGQPPLE